MRYLTADERRKMAERMREKAREWEDWEKDCPESKLSAKPESFTEELVDVIGLLGRKGWEPIRTSEVYSRMGDLIDPDPVLVPDVEPHAFEHRFYNCPHCGQVYGFDFPYQPEEKLRCEKCGGDFTLKVEWVPRLTTSKSPTGEGGAK